jgi:branched-chain amino acid transport system permease protein
MAGAPPRPGHGTSPTTVNDGTGVQEYAAAAALEGSHDLPAQRPGPLRRVLNYWPLLALLLLLLAPYGLSVSRVHILRLALVGVLFATSLNLILGYGGLVSFGHAAFYGIGAYTVALLMTKAHWPAMAGIVAAPFAAALLAAFVGAISLRSRQLYFAMITLGFSQLVYVIVDQWYSFTGGDNGIFGIDLPAWMFDVRKAYFFILAVVAVSLFVLWRITRSPFGATLRCTRENRDRAEAIGIDVYRHQLIAFIISGFFAGLAGAMFVVDQAEASPTVLFWTRSGDPVIWSLVGGMFTFMGPAIGAVLLIELRDIIGNVTTYWQFILGAILLIIVLFFPEGIGGLFSGLFSGTLRQRFSSSPLRRRLASNRFRRRPSGTASDLKGESH